MTSGCNSEFKIPSVPERGLLALADAADVSTEALYGRCISLMNSIEFEEQPIREFFLDSSGDVTTNSLKQRFTVEQVAEINAILQWYHVVLMGCLPENDGYKDDLVEVKKFLGVSCCVEVLSPSVKLVSPANPLSLEDVLALCTQESISDDDYSRFLKTMKEAFISNTSVDVIIANVELYVDFWVAVSFRDLVSKMEATERIRSALFISIIAQYSNEEALVRELDLKGVGKLPSDISEEMRQQLNFISEALANPIKENGVQASSGMHCSGGSAAFLSPPVSFAKMDILGLPNWMPNGGNTCYISATLWSLFLLLQDKVEQKIATFGAEGSYRTPAEKAAQEAFKSLYEKIAANEISNIPRAEINSFRRAMQTAFPNRFIAPYASSQEDAYEFLAATVRDLLGLDCCNESVSKFLVLHTFERVNEEPLDKAELYDYNKALAPSYSKQLSYVLDIRLDEQAAEAVIFKDLVTTVRQTDVVDRNAYLHQLSPDLPKYQSVPTRHAERFMVESKLLAPEFFCGRVTRFSVDYTTGVQKKRFDHITPSASLEFQCKENLDETVPYDLAAICVHSGYSVNAGHYYTYFRKPIAGEYRWFKYDDIHGPEQCQNEQQVLQDVSKNGYIYYYKKRSQDSIAPPELVIQEVASAKNPLSQAKEWIDHKLEGAFVIDESKGCHPAFSNQEQEAPSFKELAEQLKQAIYLVDPSGDRDLHILEDGYPIPGDLFRYGEDFASNGIQYIYKQQDGSYLVLAKSR